jgi:hypothetical protein
MKRQMSLWGVGVTHLSSETLPGRAGCTGCRAFVGIARPPGRAVLPRLLRLLLLSAALRPSLPASGRLGAPARRALLGMARRHKPRPPSAESGPSRRCHRLLQPIYDRFTEGFDTADLIVAKRLLDEWGVPNAGESCARGSSLRPLRLTTRSIMRRVTWQPQL